MPVLLLFFMNSFIVGIRTGAFILSAVLLLRLMHFKDGKHLEFWDIIIISAYFFREVGLALNLD